MLQTKAVRIEVKMKDCKIILESLMNNENNGKRERLRMRVSCLALSFLAVLSCSEHEEDETPFDSGEKNVTQHVIVVSSSEDKQEEILLDPDTKAILDEVISISSQSTFSDLLELVGISFSENSEALY